MPFSQLVVVSLTLLTTVTALPSAQSVNHSLQHVKRSACRAVYTGSPNVINNTANTILSSIFQNTAAPALIKDVLGDTPSSDSTTTPTSAVSAPNSPVISSPTTTPISAVSAPNSPVINSPTTPATPGSTGLDAATTGETTGAVIMTGSAVTGLPLSNSSITTPSSTTPSSTTPSSTTPSSTTPSSTTPSSTTPSSTTPSSTKPGSTTPVATGTAATVKLGTIVGAASSGYTKWLGIPYAQAPTGDLRLRKPVAPTATYPGGTFQATQPAQCMQFSSVPDLAGFDDITLHALIGSQAPPDTAAQSEDCLTLNIYRPDTTSTQPLPVLFYIFGGGFEFGSSNGLDPTSLLSKSVQLNLPIMLVTINYRIGGWGFLAGQELSAEGNTNLGLRDQRLALQWVADNIAAFGGDPDHVTIWGQSAGALSVVDQTIINGGAGDNGKLLFAGAIMDSGSIVPTQNTTSQKAQNVFDFVASACPANEDKLACLRAMSSDDFKNASNSVPSIFSAQSVNLEYLPRPDNSDDFFPASSDQAITQGTFAKVPIISGNARDEGTLFALAAEQRLLNSTDAVKAALQYFFPTPDPLPAGYGDPIGALVDSYNVTEVNDAAPKGYPGYPLLATIIGDATFIMNRRAYLQIFNAKSGGIPAWSYWDDHLDGVTQLGTFHTSELPYIYTDNQVGNYTYTDSFPANAYMGPDIQERYIRFINFQDPNKGLAASSAQWPQYGASAEMLQFGTQGVSNIADTMRDKTFSVLAAAAASPLPDGDSVYAI